LVISLSNTIYANNTSKTTQKNIKNQNLGNLQRFALS